MVKLEGLCVGTTEVRLREDAELDIGCNHSCDSKRTMTTAIPCPVRGTWVPAVHANCYHNEVRALVTRSLKPTPGPAEGGRAHLRRAFEQIKRVASRYGGQQWGYDETAHSYTGALRRRYLEAKASLLDEGPVCSRDTKIKAFLKAEKVRLDVVSKPRMIFPRSPRYNLHIASWLKPFEHWLWGNLKSGALSCVGNSRVVAKGLNQVQRANLIARKMRGFADCVVFEVDGSSFEAHITKEQLELEHSVYLKAYRGDSDLQKALSYQLFNKGKTFNGVKFSREGGRASGDFNTGMGNSLIMCAVVTATMGVLKRPYDMLVDGDNALIFLSGKDVDFVRGKFHNTALYVSGHEIVLENPVSVYEKVRFGQSGPVQCSKRGNIMVRDWRKVLSQATSSHHNLPSPAFSKKYLRGIALCEASLGSGIPIVWKYTRNLLKLTENTKIADVRTIREYQYLGVDVDNLDSVDVTEPDEKTRLSFERGWGLTIAEQLLIERELDDMLLDTSKSDNYLSLDEALSLVEDL